MIWEKQGNVELNKQLTLLHKGQNSTKLSSTKTSNEIEMDINIINFTILELEV